MELTEEEVIAKLTFCAGLYAQYAGKYLTFFHTRSKKDMKVCGTPCHSRRLPRTMPYLVRDSRRLFENPYTVFHIPEGGATRPFI